MEQHTFGDEHLRAVLSRDARQCLLELIDVTSGRRWGPVPLLQLEIYAKAEFRVETLETYRIDELTKTDSGVHLSLGDSARQLRLGLWLEVRSGELVVRMPMSELYEGKDYHFRLFSAVLLPGLMTAGADGAMFLPLNSGMLCYPRYKPKLADRFMLYGEQTRWELLPTLPVCGVQTPSGGLMALATGAPGEIECHVATDGQGGGRVGLGLTARQFWPDPLEFATREVRYAPIAAKSDLTLTVAKRVRRHVREDLGKPTLRQRQAESPVVASMLESYTMKLFYAVENRGIMMEGRDKTPIQTFRKVMSFAEAGENLRRLKAAGIDRIYTQSVGWNPRGHDGLYPTRFPIEERLGGEKAFRNLIALGNSLGFTMNVHDNQKSAYQASPDWDVEKVYHDQWGIPMALGEWGGGPTYILNESARSDIECSMRQLQALGLTGPGYLDGMGNPLYRDYHPRHRTTRTGYAQGINLLIEVARRVYGSCGTECGFLYCCIPADCLCTGGSEWMMKACWPQWTITQLMDRRVPAWQLAMHGLVMLENPGLSWRMAMETVLMGDHPRDEWSAHPGVMPVLDDARVRMLRANYDLCLKRFGRLQLEELVAYEESAAGVKRTRFEDGTEVVADFNKEELAVNGERIPRPAGL